MLQKTQDEWDAAKIKQREKQQNRFFYIYKAF